MPRPEPSFISFEIDGREVRAPEGAMLVDAAKFGDVEIPVFCYEPKLGAPVGACRMCLVEIEGIPKLQTGCSTPVKDGMVVVTHSERVRQAQNAVVEFLLVNHPLDCPVCDKGGECPLQDISYGWGPGRSRFIEPKRHFKKPLELSPMVAIDRERCILCFRCVRFSPEISEDYQLVFLERGDHSYVGTHDGAPYVGPFSGNIIDLCPVGALTSTAYRFRARPWDIEGAGSVCTLCPSQCNLTFTVRDDDKVLRAVARDNHDVDDGWLCDKGRFGYQAIHSPERITEPMVRDGGALRPVPWERALSEAAAGLHKAGAATAALAGGQTTNEEGFLLARLMREVLGSPHLDSRAGGPLDSAQARALARPELTAAVPDIDYAGAILILDTELVEEMPILDLRVRKAKRRNGAKVVVATSRPGALDSIADAVVRFSPGAGEAALYALVKALEQDPDLAVDAGGVRRPDPDHGEERRDQGGLPDGDPARVGAEPARRDSRLESLPVIGGLAHRLADVVHQLGGDDSAARRGELDGHAGRAGADSQALRDAAAILLAAPSSVVLWGERIGHGARGSQAVHALLGLVGRLGLAATDGSGLIEIPEGTNARGLREVGCLPNLGPGLRDIASAGLSATDMPGAIGEQLSALVLLGADPLHTHPDRGAWEGALERSGFVVAFASFLDEALDEHANVVFPAESYAEREGTITHPDGRLQRLRQAIGHPGEVRPAWSVLAELAHRIDADFTPYSSAAQVSAELGGAVPFYEGITLERMGGQGMRWPARAAAAVLPPTEIGTDELETPPDPPDGMRLGIVPSLWAGPETRHAAVLSFLAPRQRAELSAEDARRLGIAPGDDVEVRAGERLVHATAALRDGLPVGSVFLTRGTDEQSVTALTNGAVPVVEVSKA